MKRIFVILVLFVLLVSSIAAQNTAKFPGAVPTTADLGVASNRAETTLTTGINASVTSIPVASSSAFKAGTFATIDAEILHVCAIPDGNHLTVGLSSCPNVDGRGTDTSNGGGAAASHLASAKVQGRIVAWNQNQVAAEIVAMGKKLHEQFVNVDDYGAKGDGTTDDTAAFAATFAASRHVSFTKGKVYVLKDLVVPVTDPALWPGGNMTGLTIQGNGASLQAGDGASWIIKLTDAGVDGASWPNGNHRDISNFVFKGTVPDMMIVEGGCYWSNQIYNLRGDGIATNMIRLVQAPLAPCQPGAITIQDITSYTTVDHTIYFDAQSSTQTLNLWDDFRIAHIFNYSTATTSATLLASDKAYLSNSWVEGIVKVGKGYNIKWSGDNTYIINSHFQDIYSESSQVGAVNVLVYAVNSEFSNLRDIISNATDMPANSAIYLGGTSANNIITAPQVTDSEGALMGQQGTAYPVVRIDAPADNIGIMGISPGYVANSVSVDPSATNIWTPTGMIIGSFRAPRIVAGAIVDDGGNALQGSSGRIYGCCFDIDSTTFSALSFRRSGVQKWIVANDTNNDFQIASATDGNKLTIDHTTNKVNAWNGFESGGTAGLSIVKTVKGSDGSNCTLTFSGGILTATTCP